MAFGSATNPLRKAANLILGASWFFPLRMKTWFSGPARRICAAGAIIDAPSFRLRNNYGIRGRAKPDEARYIVSADINEIYSGLGCLLHVLPICWDYARKTRRTLVIDWRGNPYTRDQPDSNLFGQLFEVPSRDEIGVHCIADNSVNELELPQPVLGPAGTIAEESGQSYAMPNGGVRYQDMRDLIANGVDIEAPTIIPPLQVAYSIAQRRAKAHAYGLRRSGTADLQHFFASLQLRPEWASIVSDYYRTHMEDRPVIGVHVRHGNGEATYREHFKNRQIPEFSDFVENLGRKINRYATKRFGSDYTVFLCTDSDEVVTEMEPHFTALASRSIWRPEAGQGVDFDHAHKRPEGGLGAAVDALVDMQLLAKCDAVLMTRPTAFASHVPFILDRPGAEFLDHRKTARLPAA